MKKIIGALVLCTLFVAPAFCDTPPDIKKGIEAHKRGNFEVALAVFLPLAKQGNLPAQYLTGAIYRDQKNYTEAMKWFSQAAAKGYAGAQFQIGKMYIYGRGVPQNYTEAYKWFLAAVDGEKDPYAMEFLGRMAYWGHVIPRSNITAHMWFNLASAHGNTEADKLRDTLAEEEMTSKEIAKAQRLAQEWMEKYGGVK